MDTATPENSTNDLFNLDGGDAAAAPPAADDIGAGLDAAFGSPTAPTEGVVVEDDGEDDDGGDLLGGGGASGGGSGVDLLGGGGGGSGDLLGGGGGASSGGDLFGSGVGGGDSPSMSSAPMSSGMGMMSMGGTPGPILKWREEQAALLADKDAEASANQQAALTQAEKDLQDFYEERKKTVESSKGANRESEKAFVEERDGETPEGKEWERVVSLVDLASREDYGQETARIRNIYISLKNNPIPIASF